MPLRLHAFGPGDRQPAGLRGSRFKLAVILTMTAAVAAAAFVVAPLPAPRAVPLPGTEVEAALARRTVRGAFHVHTTRSDGSGDKPAVARAAREAGLQFVVITDHGDGTRPVDTPEYVEGVLCVDAVEISTNGGHYVALGAEPSPYPLGGESSAVVEDVARLGGFGIAAHPVSARSELAWTDWSLPVDAVEWMNADSEWRDESRWRLTRAIAGYPLRPAAALASLLDRPESTLARWDALAQTRRVVAVAGHDAHGGVGARMEQPTSRRRIRVPSYEASFRAFSTIAELDRPFTGQAVEDGRLLLDAFRRGSTYTSIDALARASTLEFIGETAAARARQGSVLWGDGPAAFKARAPVPQDATTIAFRNGVEFARTPGGALEFASADPGAYRIEIHVPGAPGDPPVPWIVSNSIFRLAPLVAPANVRREVVLRLPLLGWRIEKEQGSRATLTPEPGEGELALEYALGSGGSANQFVALVTDLPPDVPAFDAVMFTARAGGPMRVSVQLRYARDGQGRWGKSVFLDSARRDLIVPVSELRRADGPSHQPDARHATSLLFVVDLVNARPGASGVIVLSEISLARRF